ncbi:MAG: UTP--glucose-1-phosphate uridylyltransferase GalU [Tissierellia bacterium]|nr:UTP--glucose-1-phosphate uridylyltransferase GalU [Tissierellia bacterium]
MILKVKKAVIPAAGLGTRFLPATKATPKEMLPIVDKPTLQYIVEEAVASGVEEILIITGRQKTAIEEHFDRNLELEMELERNGKLELLKIVKDIPNLIDIHYVRQQVPLGLGHAIYRAKSFVGNEPFAVLLGDDLVYNPEKPCLSQLIEVFEKTESSVVGVQKVDNSQVSSYGIIDTVDIDKKIMKVNSLVEKPIPSEAPSNVAVMGRYIITPEIFNILKTIPEGKGGEIQLTDALNILAKKENVLAYEFEGKRYDVGDKLGFIKATIEFALRNPKLKDSLEEYLKELIH